VAERYVLDTSAILAFTDNEEGADEVQQLLEAARARQCVIEVCAISLMELAYITEREQGEDEAARLVALVKAWPITWVYPEEKTLLQAAKLKATHRLSVADALIAAVAKLSPAILVHKDPEFAALASQIVLRALPFKPTRPPATT
jgi:predicted nucleic acid-binding protein